MRHLFAVVLLLAGFAQAAEYHTGPVPSWVVAVAPDPAAPLTGETTGGVRSLLADQQTRIERNGKTSYSHYASRALDSKGIDEAADISIAFDPTYQSLTLHFLKVIRAGQAVDRMKSATYRVLQRETEMEYRIYDGRKTLNITLDDVRAGDTVEYAYSVAGLNPVFQNKVSGGADLQWAVPVERVVVRLLAPAERNFVIKMHNSKDAPVVKLADGVREYRWDLSKVPALRVEKDAPAEFDPYPSAQWSEFTDWNEVVQWALPLYRMQEPGAAINREIAAIRAKHIGAGARLLAVLALVQREVRYLGVETGASSHAPAAPSVVFQRRFGDCKDKALLVVTMLRALGIDASVALVNTKTRSGIASYSPTPHAFDHVIVRAMVDGKAYWVDPTRSPQKGDLAHLHQADYGLALVLSPGINALMPMAIKHMERKEVRSVFDSTDGVGKPVRYTIETTIRGGAAENLRAQLASRGATEMGQDYLNFYARRYPTIVQAKPMDVSDDETRNTLITREYYAIPDFWPHSAARKRRQAEIQPSEIAAKFDTPASVKRSVPLRVNFPEEIDEVTIIKLPESWDIEPRTVKVDHAAFEYSHATEMSDNGMVLTLKDSYRARAGQVMPAAMEAYAAGLRKADKAVGFSLYMNDADDAPAIKASFEWRQAGGIVLFCSCIMCSLLFQTSQQIHREVNGQLLVTFGWVAFALVMLGMLLHYELRIVYLSGALLMLLVVRLNRIARAAPATHAVNGLWMVSQPGAQSMQFLHKVGIGFAVLSLLALLAEAALRQGASA